MEVGNVAQVAQGPITQGAPALGNHRGQAEIQGSVGQLASVEMGDQFETIVAADGADSRRDARRLDCILLAIGREGVARPLAGGGKVEFPVARIGIGGHESLEAGAAPEAVGATARPRWRKIEAIKVAVQAIV